MRVAYGDIIAHIFIEIGKSVKGKWSVLRRARKQGKAQNKEKRLDDSKFPHWARQGLTKDTNYCNSRFGQQQKKPLRSANRNGFPRSEIYC
jgi:hypothetical protein